MPSFSDLRTAEGAKRLQQRACGPATAMSFNLFVSVGVVMMNKLVLGKIGFDFPICLTLIHYMVSWSLMAVLKFLSLLPPAKTTMPFSYLLAFGVAMSVSTGLANVSLKYNSVGFHQMSKMALTPIIVLSELILFGKTVSFPKALALAVVSAGVALATAADLEFHLLGACFAMAWIVPSVANKILWSRLQQQGDWTALALMWRTTPITVLFLAVLMPLIDPPGVLSFGWSVAKAWAVSFSALLGFLLQFSSALALGATSAVSHVVLGQFKTCVILLGGFVFYGSNPGVPSLCGALAALAGTSAYAYACLPGSPRRVERRQKTPKPRTESRKGDDVV